MGKPASLASDGRGCAGGLFGEARSGSGGDATASSASSGRSVGIRWCAALYQISPQTSDKSHHHNFKK